MAVLLVPFFLASTDGLAQAVKFFPTNTIGGYTDFSFAPPHNEWDLNRCRADAGSAANGGSKAPCTAFARSALSGYFEAVPISAGPFKKLYGYISPRFYFGDNLPQVRYSESFGAIAMETSMGLIYELPRGFEARLNAHYKFHWFGKYQNYLGAADIGGDGPFGQYNSISVRWKFGTFNSRRHE